MLPGWLCCDAGAAAMPIHAATATTTAAAVGTGPAAVEAADRRPTPKSL